LSALLRAVAGLLVETALWCGVVAAVAAIISGGLLVIGTPRRPGRVVAVAALGAAIAVGIADRIGLPLLWRLGPAARAVPVVWSAVGAAVTCLVLYGRDRATRAVR